MPDPKDLEGQRIGRYLVERHLATGGMANVYVAHDVDLERRIALKVMLPELAKDEQFVQRFRREGQAVAKLDHPNIVKVYDIGFTNDGHPYIAMQYVDGTSLRETLQQLSAQEKLLPTIQSLWVARQIADALQFAHAAGVVHRDLKPSNVLIRADGTPVLVDLGIAVVQGSTKLTRTGSIIGTPHYMSPEQVQGKTLDGRSDIYSLGVILYELLSGHVPFDAPESMAVLHKHVYEAPPTLALERPGLARETYEVTQTCLKKIPAERYQNAAQLIAALDAAVAAEGAGSWLSQTGTWRVPPMGTLLVNKNAEQPVQTESEVSAWRRYWWAPVLLLLLLIPVCGFGAFALYENGPFSREPDPTVVALAYALTSQAIELAGATETVMAQDAVATATAGQATVSDNLATDSPQGSTAEAASTPTDEPLPTATPLPTNTPLPPTDPPPPTSTIPPPPTVTPAPTACSVQVHSPFSSLWSANESRLGCATSAANGSLWMAEESFERGRMFWRSDNDQIYAVYSNGVWASYNDLWVEGDPEYSCGSEQSPPTPRRGFGKIWCTYENVRNGLGNATTGESGVNATIQSFTNGFILQPGGGRAYVFTYDGAWR